MFTSSKEYREVDPKFVADIEELIGGAFEDSQIGDLIWQRWLETLPDYSVRRSRIHRKGRAGFSGDAFRAFGHAMFHGSHQLARLTFGIDLQKSLDEAGREAAASDDPNRQSAVVEEMVRRHEFTMSPTGAPWSAAATSAAFVYYLGVTPAAAMVNISQTTVVGIPILAAGFKKATATQAAGALAKALRDFTSGRGDTMKSKHITGDERAALSEAYRRGAIDRTQAHDLAAVSETGIEYSARRQRIMGVISYLFHHAERLNREVTFLAGYRMAKANGLQGEAAIDKAADLTWKTHFDYQNTSRPRVMQGDMAKVLLTFRNFQVNMLWRLFRDTHQAFKGADPETRLEARRQLVGITASMMLHAGNKGTWGYALITTLLGFFFAGGSDDVEEALQDGLVNTFGPGFAGLMLNGVPGHTLGIDLTSRIGMPELWFRKSDRTLEGDDVYNY